MEGSGHEIICGAALVFAWRDWETMRNLSVVGVSAEIRSGDIQNTGQKR
jgi:hypothetical protein